MSFNPQDNTQLCVVGNTIFRHFRYSEGNLKPFSFQKLEPQNYLCHAWVTEERIVVGTDNGRLLIFEAGEMKSEIYLGKDDKYVKHEERVCVHVYVFMFVTETDTFFPTLHLWDT